ncbi:MAG: ABC transporter ATP-binding protein [Muribaculaceae bacterium]|nr:ABC transporter ATP-binding protein [Muribaculaceae bacterium]
MILQADISIGYGCRAILQPLRLQLRECTLTALIGANGAGKSTLLRTLTGSQKPLRGSIAWRGRDIKTISRTEMARTVSLVCTDRTLAGDLTIGEVVALGRQPYTGIFGRLGADDRRIAAEAMEAVGIATIADRALATLSDGERQKTMIARALAQATPVMLLDEPTSFLDAASRIEVMQLLRRLCDMRGKTILLSTHDIAPAMAVADNLWVIDRTDGNIVCGSRDEIMSSGAMDRVFDSADVHFDIAAADYRFSGPR